ncbi:RNA polymerase sigma factor SigJ [Micromonospora zhanjiangensis]|uniref:RNA polymerase sigma factor SigJ n=1 Tax=Micromonospora zhanjiangensis TaxID=1522057 RepID=A0ABV8KV05_9ACTN
MSGTSTTGSAGALQAHRPMLLGLAYRMVGSLPDAEDILQDAYLRWLTVDRESVAEPRRYLSRVVSRLAIDKLRARRASREAYVGPWLPEPVPTGGEPFGPLDRVEQRETLSVAMLHVLERLNPIERAVYLLRTAFDLPYTEIAGILDRSPADCRQLHHRAVAHVGQDRTRFTADPAEQERLLTAFLAAARDGDLAGLTALVATNATAWSDGGGRVRAALNPVYGADKIARFAAGVLGPHRTGLRFDRTEVNGQPAVVTRQPGRAPYLFTVGAAGGRITGLYLVGNPEKLAWLT